MLKRLKNKIANIVCKSFVDLKNVKIGKDVFFAHHTEITDSKIGDKSSIGRYTKVRNTCIGKYCSISWNVTIGASSHPLDRISTHAFSYKKKFKLVENDDDFKPKETIIGNDVWIGCNVVIMSGIKVGNGAVIGSGAIVTKDVEPYSIVAGVPAKFIRKRFDDEIIQLLDEIKWWNLDDKILKKYISFFQKKINVEDLKKLKEIINEKI